MSLELLGVAHTADHPLLHGSSHNYLAPPPRMVILAQLNLVGNELPAATSQTRQFNLRRAEYELPEAERGHAAFKRKYEAQLAPTDSTFAPPLRKRERVRE